MKFSIYLALTLSALAYAGHKMNWDDHLYYAYHSVFQPEAETALGRYVFQEKIEIPDVGNLSGVVCDPEGEHLYMILNNPETILECDLRGNILRRIDLVGFQDTEGLCYDQNGNLTVIEERRQSIITLPHLNDVDVIQRSDVLNASEFALFDEANDGFEGLTYSALHESFFIVKEKQPAAVFQFSNHSKSQSFKRLLEIKNDKLYIDDISDIYCRSNGNLLLLSDESATLVECDLSGEVQGYLELDAGFHGNPERIPQAEGVCLDNEGTLYIVSEPNLLYVYRLP